MADHWRHTRARTDVMRGVGEDEARYYSGWLLSAVTTIAVVLLAWHYKF